MATDFFIKQGDTAPSIICVLQDANAAAIDLTTASSVRFIMSDKLSGDNIVDATAFILDVDEGKVEYNWTTGDTDVVSTYNAEFEVHWADDTYETYPNDKYIVVKVVKDLGGLVG